MAHPLSHLFAHAHHGDYLSASLYLARLAALWRFCYIARRKLDAGAAGVSLFLLCCSRTRGSMVYRMTGVSGLQLAVVSETKTIIIDKVYGLYSI